MMTISKIRSDLGGQVFEITCSCEPDKFFILNLERGMLVYNPATGIVRCPRCGDEIHKKDVLLKEKELRIAAEETRQQWQRTNQETGEQIE